MERRNRAVSRTAAIAQPSAGWSGGSWRVHHIAVEQPVTTTRPFCVELSENRGPRSAVVAESGYNVTAE